MTQSEHLWDKHLQIKTTGRDDTAADQYRYPYEQVLTEIPAGKRERGEDPLLTAKRELEEETGYSAASFEPLGIVYPTPGFCDEVLYLYLATALIETAPHPDEDEFLQVERQPLDSLVAEILAGRIADAKTQIALLKTYLLLQQKGE